ncbi:MAG: diaminopimelate epimerase [Oligoflexia bacterium]|nr:diaminopimelate epimerase [Oligoflexia bacterium]
MDTCQKIIWTKMSGAGNSFWITYLSPSFFPDFVDKDWPEVARKICQREDTSDTGDGLVVLVPSRTCDLKWLFYNADGSSAEMCGNAACCVTEYAFKKGVVPADRSSVTFETLAQKIKGDLVREKARIFLKQNESIEGPFKMDFNSKTISYMFINSSVPHAVIKLTKWSEAKEWTVRKELARVLRRKTTHHKNGMNVSFYCCSEEEGRLFARTFERGVEDFTSACGTGALAVAQIHRQAFSLMDFMFVEMPGGQLKVGFHSDKTVSLMSPVKWLKEMEWHF